MSALPCAAHPAAAVPGRADELPAGQRRPLGQIGRTLLEGDGRPGSLLAIVTRLAGDEAMPRAERVAAGPLPLWLRPGVAAAIGLAAALSISGRSRFPFRVNGAYGLKKSSGPW
jgi:hypothetical protein